MFVLGTGKENNASVNRAELDDRPKHWQLPGRYVTLNWSAGAGNIPSRLGPQVHTNFGLWPQDIDVAFWNLLRGYELSSSIQSCIFLSLVIMKNYSLTLIPHDSPIDLVGHPGR